VLAHGTSRSAVALDVITGREQATNEVNAGYGLVLGRGPDAAGLNYFVSLRQGILPEITRQDLDLDLLNSAENLARIRAAIASSSSTDTPDSIAQGLLYQYPA
jgi:hypothetical protein